MSLKILIILSFTTAMLLRGKKLYEANQKLHWIINQCAAVLKDQSGIDTEVMKTWDFPPPPLTWSVPLDYHHQQ